MIQSYQQEECLIGAFDCNSIQKQVCECLNQSESVASVKFNMKISRKSQLSSIDQQDSVASQQSSFCLEESQHQQNSQSQSQAQSSESWNQEEEKRKLKISKKKKQQLNFQQATLDIQKGLYEKQTLKKTVAEALIRKKKINCEIIKQELKNKKIDIFLNSDKYKATVQSVATEIIRAIERFLQVQCNMEIQPLSRRGIELILRKIINYQQHFDKVTGAILRNFVRYLYQFGDIQIQKSKVYHLYQKVADLTLKLNSQKYKTTIFQKVKEKWEQPRVKISSNLKLKQFQEQEAKFTTMDDVNKQWNEHFEMFLIKCYKQNQDFSHIRCSFCEVYPKKKHLWSVDSLKNRFERTMRRAYNRLRVIIECETSMKKASLPEMIPMDQRLIKILISRMYPTELRLKFIELLQGKKDRQLIQWLILRINAQLKSSKKFFYALNLPKKKRNTKLQ